ncbi:MAG TPA: hypothetical protein VFP68_20890, partial [Burkholderiaceae bacterium]|nr:hypothetical protein [Burkholderiaceae bacterium]
SCPVQPGCTLADLTQLGVLDRRFAQWAHEAAFLIEVVQSDDIERVRNELLGAPAPSPPALPSVRGASHVARARRKPRP